MAPYSRKRKYVGGIPRLLSALAIEFDVEFVFVGVVVVVVVCFVVSLESDELILIVEG